MKKEYARPQSWAIALGDDIMDVTIGISGTRKDEPGPANAPRYQSNDNWDEE